MSQILNLSEKSQYILIADDDAEELMLLKDAREENRIAHPHYFVENGKNYWITSLTRVSSPAGENIRYRL